MPEPAHRIRFVADRGDARLRLDQVLVRRAVEVARLSRARAQAWIQRGLVWVDGRPARRAAARVRDGAAVEIDVPDASALRARAQPEHRELRVLYEDEHLLAVDKPPGLVVHPSFRNPSGTLLNAVLGRYADRPGMTPGIVTRLDKETSGVMIVALTPGTHRRLQAAGLEKEYLAIVAGAPSPPAGVIDLALARDPSDRRRVIVAREGRHAATHYTVLSMHEGVSLVRCTLLTGRTHQIRVHLAARGWPIVGDRRYGVAHDRISRTALHSWRVAFEHPVTGAPLDIRAELPSDLEGPWSPDAPEA